jgi:hypothetical protein
MDHQIFNLYWFGRMMLWEIGECCKGYFICPYEYGDHKFGVKIFLPDGEEMADEANFETAQDAIEIGRSYAREDLEAIEEYRRSQSVVSGYAKE